MFAEKQVIYFSNQNFLTRIRTEFIRKSLKWKSDAFFFGITVVLIKDICSSVVINEFKELELVYYNRKEEAKNNKGNIKIFYNFLFSAEP